jgi:cytochrome c-type biogenesis protein
MIEQFFTWLNHLSEQGNIPALIAAFAWGIGSILLSPCHLASIPLVVAYVNRGQTLQTQKAFWLSFLFACGIFLSILAIGLVTASLGRMLGDIGPWGKYIIAAVFLLFGLVLLEVISLPWSGANFAKNSRTGAWGAVVLGLVFGAAVGPCTFAYMAPILAVAFNEAEINFLFAVLLIVLYSIGHCSVIVLAGTIGARLQTFLNWDQKSNLTARLRKICGVILISVGLYLLWKA